jgi:hypothetical protein
MGKEATFAQYMDSFKDFEKSVTSSKGAAIEFLKSVGFLDEKGKVKHHNGNGHSHKSKEPTQKK